MAASRAAEAAADAERRRIVEETLLTERAAEKAGAYMQQSLRTT